MRDTSNPRSTSRIAGLLFFVTHVTSVAAVVFYGGGAFDATLPLAGRSSVLTGALLEIVLAAAVVGTSVALYPLVRRAGEALAAGYIGLRTLEASVILTGVVALLPVVAIPGSRAGSGLSPEVIAGLRLVHDWTFVLGPGLICPINTLVIAWLLFNSGQVPRWIPTLGLGGAALIGLVNVGVLFGLTPTQPIAAVPIFAWEIALASYLVFRGIKPATQEAPAEARLPEAFRTVGAVG